MVKKLGPCWHGALYGLRRFPLSAATVLVFFCGLMSTSDFAGPVRAPQLPPALQQGRSDALAPSSARAPPFAPARADHSPPLPHGPPAVEPGNLRRTDVDAESGLVRAICAADASEEWGGSSTSLDTAEPPPPPRDCGLRCWPEELLTTSPGPQEVGHKLAVMASCVGDQPSSRLPAAAPLWATHRPSLAVHAAACAIRRAVRASPPAAAAPAGPAPSSSAAEEVWAATFGRPAARSILREEAALRGLWGSETGADGRGAAAATDDTSRAEDEGGEDGRPGMAMADDSLAVVVGEPWDEALFHPWLPLFVPWTGLAAALREGAEGADGRGRGAPPTGPTANEDGGRGTMAEVRLLRGSSSKDKGPAAAKGKDEDEDAEVSPAVLFANAAARLATLAVGDPSARFLTVVDATPSRIGAAGLGKADDAEGLDAPGLLLLGSPHLGFLMRRTLVVEYCGGCGAAQPVSPAHPFSRGVPSRPGRMRINGPVLTAMVPPRDDSPEDNGKATMGAHAQDAFVQLLHAWLLDPAPGTAADAERSADDGHSSSLSSIPSKGQDLLARCPLAAHSLT